MIPVEPAALLVYKVVRQRFTQNQDLCTMMETFRQMVNECIRIGLDNNISTLRKFSSNHYHDLKKYDIQSKYKLTAMSQACGRLAQMKRTIKEGRIPKSPYIQKPYLVSCYGFKINGMLLSIPIGNRKYINIILNHHTQQILSDKSLKIKSFVITPDSISLGIQKEVEEIKCDDTIGIDRNLRNVTAGNHEKVIMYDMADLPRITYRTKKVTSSFKRNDHRIRQKIYSKLGNRRARRIKQFLNRISKDIVEKARESNSMIILEDIRGIRKLYRKGNYQGRKYRGMMNSWPFYELQRQVQYKSAWEGIPVRFVSPVRTSILCPICGNRTRKDAEQHRQVWCSSCKKMMDRDVVAAMNISYKGLQRFCNPSGLSEKAMKGNLDDIMPVILR
ncbi:MAG: IS200/IS605 family element transposase accessory protein TnpB, partial [Thaumarchaeota archaeon]|nr:IS200/IS605 family element transposase accessory protein TnpB [Nitrososphaerota archaeon]